MKWINIIIILLIGQSSFGQNKVQRIDSFLTSLHESGNLNGNILLAEKGKVIYNKSFGVLNDSTKEKLNENSIFRLASVSKQFTAMAIVILKEKGKLKYNAEISKYIPELSHYSNITIKHLLNHTSGIPQNFSIDKSFGNIATNTDLIAALAKYKPKVTFKPNTKWEYNNTNYNLLASIIEKVSGMSYGDYLAQTIFKPLEMENTFVYTRGYVPKKVANYVYGYVYSDVLKKYVLAEDMDKYKWILLDEGIVGSQGVYSTVIDLLKWDRALYTNKLITNESKREIFTSSVLDDKSKTEYGFGWRIDDNGVYGTMLWHGGSWPGYGTYIERHIQHDKTMIILVNYVDYAKNGFFPISDLRKILYDIQPLKFIELNAEEIKIFAGNYKLKDGKIREFTYENGIFSVIWPDGTVFELKPFSKTKFFMVGSKPDIFFEFIIKDGKVEKYILTQPERKVVREGIKQ